MVELPDEKVVHLVCFQRPIENSDITATFRNDKHGPGVSKSLLDNFLIRHLKVHHGLITQFVNYLVINLRHRLDR